MAKLETAVPRGELLDVKENSVVIRVDPNDVSKDVEVEYYVAGRAYPFSTTVPDVLLLNKKRELVGECIPPENVRRPEHLEDLFKRGIYIALVELIKFRYSDG